MYLYTTAQVNGHVFVYYGSSDQSCICILQLKWAVIYLYTMGQVISHVFVYYGLSERSCICVLSVSPLSLPPIFLLGFGTISDTVVF